MTEINDQIRNDSINKLPPSVQQELTKMKKFYLIVSAVWHRLQGSILWALIFILIGMGLGMYLSNYMYNQKFEEAKNLGGIIYDHKVYDFTYKKDIQ